MLRGIIKVAAERRSEVSMVPGPIGDQIITPIIKDAAMRIGEIVGNISFKSGSARFEAKDGRIVVSHRPAGGFNLGAMENAIAQIDRSTGLEAH